MLSKLVDADEKGKVFAFLAAIQNIVTFAGAPAFYSIFYATTSWFPGLAFEIVACFQGIAVLIFFFIYTKMSRTSSMEQLEAASDDIDDD